MPWSGCTRAINCLLSWFSGTSTFVWHNWWLFALSTCNLSYFPLNSVFVLLGVVASIVHLTIFFQVLKVNHGVGIPDLGQVFADDAVHFSFGNEVLLALSMSTEMSWRSINPAIAICRLGFVVLLSIPCNKKIGCEVILDLIVEQSFSVLHHSLFLLVLGVHKLLLLELCKAIVLCCLRNLWQHLKLIRDIYLLLFEFDLSGIGSGPLLESYGRRGASASGVALCRDELNRLVWIHFRRTLVLLAAFLVCNWRLFDLVQGYVHHRRKTRTLLHDGRRSHFSHNEASTCLLFFKFTHKFIRLIKLSLFLSWAIIRFAQWLSLIATIRWLLPGWDHRCLFY